MTVKVSNTIQDRSSGVYERITREWVTGVGIDVVADIVEHKLTNQLLMVRTGTLRRSIGTYPRVSAGAKDVDIGIAAGVKYAAIHEYGGRNGRGGKSVQRERRYIRSTLETMSKQIADAMLIAIINSGENK